MRITEMLATTDALAAVFSDASIVQTMLDVEAALARAEAELCKAQAAERTVHNQIVLDVRRANLQY